MRRAKMNASSDDTFIKLTVVQITASVLVFFLLFMLSKKDATLAYRLREDFAAIMSQDWDVYGSIKEKFSSGSETPVFNGESPVTGTSEKDGYIALSSKEEFSPTFAASDLCSSFYGDDQPVMPVDGAVTSEYGNRIHPINGGESFHSGRDIAADEGTDIYAALDGTVLDVGIGESSGNYIKLDHGGGLVTLYCHCSEIYADEGECVRKGDIIAAVGATGMATGPHLHFEVHRNSVLEDPAVILDNACDVY